VRVVAIGCGASVPDGRSAGPCFWIEGDGFRLLADSGPGSLVSLARHVPAWTAVSHVFISHFHLDHIVELPAILFALKHAESGRADPLEILGPKTTLALLQGWADAVRYPFLDLPFGVSVREIEPERIHRLGPGATLRVLSTPHTEESLALRIDERGSSVGYTSDTGPSPDLAPFLEGCDLLVADCSLEEPAEGRGHLSIPEAADLAIRSGARRLLATHLFPGLDPGDVERRLRSILGPGARVARDGMSIDV